MFLYKFIKLTGNDLFVQTCREMYSTAYSGMFQIKSAGSEYFTLSSPPVLSDHKLKFFKFLFY